MPEIQHTVKYKKKKIHKGITAHTRNVLQGTLFMLPWIIGLLLITIYPLIYSMVISVNEVAIKPTGIELSWKGLQYFKAALMEDAEFPTVLLESFKSLLIGVPLVIVFALIVSLLLNHKFKGRAFFRVLFFLPVVIMSGPLMNELMNETSAMTLNFHFFNVWPVFQAMPEILWKPIYSFLSSILNILWFSGVQTLIFLAALQKIDRSMYEAASIDGATAWEKFWRITLPYLRPTIILNTIYTIVDMGYFANDGTILKIANHVTNDIARPFSYSAAMSWIYAVCMLLLILAAYLILNDWKETRRLRHDKKRKR